MKKEVVTLTPMVKPVDPPTPADPEYRVYGQIHSIIETKGELIFLGTPMPDEDEYQAKDIYIHDCDQMGCRLSHVLWRYNKVHGRLYGENK